MAIAWRARPGRSAPAVVRQSVFEVVRSMGFGDVASRSSPRMVEGGSWVLREHPRAVFCQAAPALHRFFHPLGALCRLGDGSHDSVLHSSTLSSFRLVGIGPGCRTSLAFESPPATWLTPSDTSEARCCRPPNAVRPSFPGHMWSRRAWRRALRSIVVGIAATPPAARMERMARVQGGDGEGPMSHPVCEARVQVPSYRAFRGCVTATAQLRLSDPGDTGDGARETICDTDGVRRLYSLVYSWEL